MAIRFSNAPNQFTVYEPGRYDFRIEDVEQNTSKNGNPQLVMKSVIVGGPSDGKKFTSWWSLVEKAQWRLNQLIEATGCPHQVVGEDGEGNPLVEFEESDLIGLTFSADVVIDNYQNKKNNKLENLYPTEDDSEPEAPVEEKKAATTAAETPKTGFKPGAAAAGVARRPRGAAQ